MDKKELSTLLSLGKGKDLDYDIKETFVDAFLRQRGKTPDTKAVCDDSGSLTYMELDKRSDIFAQELLGKGVGEGDFVAVILPRVKEFLVAVMGIWKAGAAYIPVDPSWPQERIRYIMEDSGAKFTVDESFLDDFRSDATPSSAVNKSRFDAVAVVIYTSGSTGRPKGVLNTHMGVRAECSSAHYGYAYQENDVMSQFLPFSYIVSCSDLFPPLVYGFTVYILSQRLLTDISALDEFIRQKGISVITAVPQIGVPLITRFHTPLRVIGMGGAKVEMPEGCKVKVLSGYGLTETCSTVSFVDLNDCSSGKGPLLGRPMPGVTIVLEDEDGNPVPRGEVGEICIASPQVASGYWHNPELTEKVFVDRPWSNFKAFRSGDLARWNEYGVLEFHGRKDDMVKIRGNRVELGEVESALRSLDGVGQCAAAMKDVGGESVLCCYYVSNEPISEDFIRSFLSESLPQYMIPSFFVRMSALPMLPSGKLDRLSLPLPEVASAEDIVAPSTEFEKDVFRIVSREMGFSSFGVTTNLISLGMTSLRAIRLSLSLKTELGVNVPQADMLLHPTIREWAALRTKEEEVIPLASPREYYPLTDNQIGIYIEWERDRKSDQYNLPCLLKISGGDSARLHESVGKAIGLHPSLKTHFVERDGKVMQHRRDDAKLDVGFESLDFEPDENFFRKLVTPFDLIDSDLARFKVYSSPQAAWLFFDVHHSIFDGSSANVFVQTLSKFYRGEKPLAESVTSYDYALYKENWMATDAFDASGRYFEKLLEDTESFIYPSLSAGKGDGQLETFLSRLPRGAVRSFCRRCSVTENSFFATALTQLFHRIWREDSIQISTFSSGRSPSQLAGCTGMFVQTLPLVSRITDGTVKDAVKSVHSQLLETLTHDKYPYIALAERFALRTGVSYVYQGDLIEKPDFGACPAEYHRILTSRATAPLTVEIVPSDNEYTVKFKYQGDRYGSDEIALLARTFSSLSAEMSESKDDTLLSDLELTQEKERDELLALGTGDTLEYDRSETFLDLFSRCVSLHPDSAAVVDCKSSLKYRELDTLSDSIASSLIDLGVKTGDFVAISLPRVKEFVASVIGVWKAGAAYVPIDQDYPEDRKRFMTEDCAAKVIITQDSPFLRKSSAKTQLESARKPTPESLAYMIYTSGSTGRPKGVMVQHGALMNFLEFQRAYWPLHQSSNIACYSSFAFDGSIKDLYSVLTVGGCLHILSEKLKLDIPAMRSYFKEHGITGCSLVTPVGAMFCSGGGLNLEYISFGGEKMKFIPDVKGRIFNNYGPTECTVDITNYELNADCDESDIPIGTLLPNNLGIIVDKSLHLVPKGAPGELCIAGVQLAAGYHNNPFLTKERFIQLRTNNQNVRFYRTGDLCRWNADGNLLFMGRIDKQVKLNGFRIEPGEIEAVALKHFQEEIKQALAIVRDDRLVLYYTGEAIDESRFAALSTDLPEYMIPSAFVHLDTMPLAPTGKIDYKALPVPEIKTSEYIAPEGERECVVAEAFSSVLNLSVPVSALDRFVSLGGNSISAMRLSSNLRNKGLSISASDILKLQTVREIAFAAETVEDDRSEIVSLPLSEDEGEVLLHESARFAYLQWERDHDTLKNNTPQALHFKKYGVSCVESSLEKLFKVHPYLNVRLSLTDGLPTQSIEYDRQIQISHTVLQTCPDREYFKSLVRPFNLLDGPLYHIELIEVSGAEGCWMFLDINHVIFDGWSNGIFLRDLFLSLDGKELSQIETGALHQFFRESICQHDDNLSLADSYFDRLLSGVSSTVFPHSNYGMLTAEKGFEVSSVPREAVSGYVRDSGITESNIFLTAILSSLQALSDEDDVSLTMGHSGRGNPEISNSIGMFVKTWPVVGRNINSMSWKEASLSVQTQVLATSALEYYPFERLLSRYGWHPEITYIYEGNLGRDRIFERGDVDELQLHDMVPSMTPVWVGAFLKEGNYQIVLQYDVALYSPRDMRRLAGLIADTVIRGCESPDSIIGDAQRLSEAELREIQELSSGEDVPYDRTKTCVDAIVSSAALYPDHPAIVSTDGKLTFGELDTRSNSLANYLIAEGVAPGSFVAMRLPEGTMFYIAALGIMKAGCGYIPMDITYPEERLSFMLADSGAGIVLTEELLGEILSSHRSDSKAVNLSTPEGPSMLLYTSGSTGMPKGAFQQHKSLWTMAAGYIHDFKISHRFNYAAVTSPSYALSLPDTYGALCCGATLHVPGPELRKDIAALARYINDNNIHGLGLSTALGKALVESGLHLGIEYMILAGEKALGLPHTDYALWNGLGSTETHYMAYHLIDGNEDVIPLGRPAPNMKALLLDGHGRLAPRGCTGELCIEGDQLVKGYWKREDLTSERFRDGVYHTGDLAYWNERGELMPVGRKDNMVKLRGYRIELEEIERCAMKIPSVVRSAAAIRGSSIVLFYTASSEVDFSSLDRSLPAFMLPSRFIRLDDMPLNVRGKLDRSALPKILERLSEDYSAPASTLEQQIFDCVSSILGTDGFGVTTNLLKAGLSSIDAMKLCFFLDKQGITGLHVSDILNNPTVRGIADLSTGKAAGKTFTFGKVQPLREYYPLAQNQLGVYFDSKRNPDGLQYNNPSVKFLSGMTTDEVVRVYTSLIDAHPYFKCRIETLDGTPVQHRRDDASPDITLCALPPDADPKSFFQSRVRPFNLEGGELCRIEVYPVEGGCWVFSDFHMITDGYSALICSADIKRLLSGNEIPKETYTAYDYALEEELYSHTEDYAADREYFRGLLEGVDSTIYPGTASSDSSGLGTKTLYISSSSVHEGAQRLGVTANVFILSRLSQTVSSMTREPKVLLATLSSGRLCRSMESSQGFFVKTVPVVYESDPVALQRQISDTISHQGYPFTEMSSEFGTSPQILYVYEGGLGLQAKKEGEDIILKMDTPKFPITLLVYPDGDERYQIVCEYDKSIYCDEDIVMLLDCLQNMISEGRMVTPAQENEILDLGRGEKLEYDSTRTFVDLFVRCAAEYPDAKAVADSKGALTYRELDTLSDSVASALIESGVQPGDFVAVMLPRVKEFVCCVLGIWKAGAAYVPIDPEYPEERKRFMIEDSCAKMLIDTDFCKGIGSGGCKRVNLSKPDGLSYMIYTSGSTGKPKGVVITNSNLRAFIAWMIPFLSLKAGDSSAEYASFSFDASVGDLFTPLASGACVHILSEELRRDLEGMDAYFRKNDIKGLEFAPQIGSEMLGSFDLSLDYLVMGGDKVTPFRPSGVRVINTYGPTEGTDSTAYSVVNQDFPSSNIPIGRSVPNMLSLILDRNGELLPRGAAGELCIAGPQIAKGYWNTPELTAEKFVDCPYLEGQKMYKTGDLVRWNENGEMEFLGRIDSQVKLHGFRIELGEVETALKRIDGIHSALADIRSINGNETLCAYYVSDHDIAPETLKAQLSKSLTPYMMPDSFTRLDAIPLSMSGKVDRKALPEPEVISDEIIAPESEQERLLFEVVSDELGTDKFGVTTNLLSMGLTSIRAIRLTLSIKQRLSLSISAADILASPTIRSWKSHETEMIALSRAREFYPLTDNQTGIYIDWERNPEGLQYNEPMVLRLPGIEASKVVSALNRIIAIHPSLKTRITTLYGEVRQRRRDEATLKILQRHLEGGMTAEFFQSRVRPFNLFEDDLSRFEVYSTDSATYLFFDIHHIIFDAEAENILLSDLSLLLSGKSIEAEKVTSFDYALFFDRWKRSKEYTEHEEYFDKLLLGTESFSFPSSAGGKIHKGGFEKLTVKIPSEKIRMFCRKALVTENSFFATAIMQVFHRLSRDESIQIATVSSGRSSSSELERTMGMFVQTLPLVCRRFTGNVTEVIRALQAQIFETLRRDRYPFTALSGRHAVKPGVLYVYQGDVVEGRVLEPVPLKLDTAKTPLNINVIPGPEGYSIVIGYDTSLYCGDDMRILGSSISNFALALSLLAEDADISTIGLTDATQTASLLKLGTGDTLEYDRSETVADLIRRSAALHPDKVAVVDCRSSMTYRELDCLSDAIACKLIDSGVLPGDFVAVMMPRVKEFSAAVLGIWKAGAAYVPIDPKYPKERIDFTVRDSCTKVLIDKAFCDSIKVGECSGVNLSSPSGPAYMIYTSGSTGTPKGVVVVQSGLKNFIEFIRNYWPVHEKSVISCYTNFAFGGSIKDLYAVLTVGGTLHILSEETRMDITGMHDYYKKNGVTGCNLVTPVGAMFCSGERLNLEYISFGGEKMKFIPNLTGKAFNTYGPTECTVDVTYYELEPGCDASNIPIGRPIPNIQCMILDEYMNMLPRGVAGELCIAGVQLARGYHHRDELTEERFVHLMVGGEEKRVYRTGDLCRWNERGLLEYIGRIDNQVKLRGFRIELGEIEAVALKQEGVRQTAAALWGDRIVLYYTGEDKGEGQFDALSSKLPDYMVPSLYVHLDSMPLTSNGKTDRRALPEPQWEEKDYVAPSNDIEIKVQRLVEDILSLEADTVSVASSLTSYGLHSVYAMRLATEIYRKFHCRVPVALLLGGKDIRSIALYILGAERCRGFLPRHHKERSLYPATSGMSGYMKDIRFGHTALLCDYPLRFRKMPLQRMLDALEKLIEAHPSLMACYKYELGNYFIYQGKGQIPVKTFVLDFEPDEKWLNENANSIDGLSGANLTCFTLIETPRYGYFMMQGSHANIDNITMYVTCRDYLMALAGLPLQKEEYTIYDFSIDEDMYYRSRQKSLDEAEYRHLVDIRETLVPYDIPSGPDWSPISSVEFSVDKAPIDDFCSRYSITVNSFFCACYMWALGALTDNTFTMATGLSVNRGYKEFANVAGQLIRTFPIVVDNIQPFDSPDFEKQALEAMNDVMRQFEEVLERPFYDYYSRQGLGWWRDVSIKTCFICTVGITDGMEGADGMFERVREEVGLDTSFKFVPKGGAYLKKTMTTYCMERKKGFYDIETQYASGTYFPVTIERLQEFMKTFIGKLI